MNRQIGVGDSKYVIVFDPLLTCHVIRRMRSGRVRIFNGNQWETLLLVTQERIGVGSSYLVARLVTYSPCTATVQGQKVKGQGHKVTIEEIYAVKGFSIGDSREQTTLNRRRSSIKVE